jgi:hypothetical protein
VPYSVPAQDFASIGAAFGWEWLACSVHADLVRTGAVDLGYVPIGGVINTPTVFTGGQ